MLICVTFSLPPGVTGWLRLLLVALPELFYLPFLYFDRLPFNRWLKLLIQIFSQLAFGIKGCSSKTHLRMSVMQKKKKKKKKNLL